MRAVLLSAMAVLSLAKSSLATGPDGYTESFELISEIRSLQDVPVNPDTFRCHAPTVYFPMTQGFLFLRGIGTSPDPVFLQTDIMRDCGLMDYISKKAQANWNQLPGEMVRRLYKVTRVYDGYPGPEKPGEINTYEKCEIDLQLNVEWIFTPHFSTHANMGPADPKACYPSKKTQM